VIISDAWVPVAGVEWDQFAIFVSEDSLQDLPAILSEHEPRWKEMGDRARQIYESHFSQPVFAVRAVEKILSIYEERDHDEREFHSQWDQILADEWERRRPAC